MTRRYFVPDFPLTGSVISLRDAEAQHAVRVMRVKVGDSITLFDGKGHESEAIVTGVTKRRCECEATAAVTIDRESTHALHLGIALPKPDRSRELIERLTELGVRSVTPLVADRTQRAPSSGLIEKLNKAVIEASKQCGRNQLMQIMPPEGAKSFFAFERSQSQACWIADPAGTPWRQVSARPMGDAVVAIGPEGGWSDDELDSAVGCGFVNVNLGRRVYRIETAAIFISSVWAD